MTEWMLKYFSLWELLLMTGVTCGMFGGWLGRFTERLNWQSDCLLEKVRPGKHIDYVCRWKPKHAPAPKTTIEELEQSLRNMKTAQSITRSMETH